MTNNKPRRLPEEVEDDLKYLYEITRLREAFRELEAESSSKDAWAKEAQSDIADLEKRIERLEADRDRLADKVREGHVKNCVCFRHYTHPSCVEWRKL